MPGPRRQEVLEQARRRRRRGRLVKWFFTLLVFPVIVLAISYGFNQDRFLLKEWVVKGERTITQGELRRVIEDVLQGKSFGLISKKSSFFYPKKVLIETLLNRFEKLSEVRVKRKNFSSITIEVFEREPVALWCQSRDNGECYFLDQTALAFSAAPVFSKPLLIELRGPVNIVALHDMVGVRPISGETFSKIRAFVSMLEKTIPSEVFSDPQVVRVEGGESNDWKFFLQERFGPKGVVWPVLINLNFDPLKVAESFAAAWETRAVAEELRNRRWELEYLDLRFVDKIFYKFH